MSWRIRHRIFFSLPVTLPTKKRVWFLISFACCRQVTWFNVTLWALGHHVLMPKPTRKAAEKKSKYARINILLAPPTRSTRPSLLIYLESDRRTHSASAVPCLSITSLKIHITCPLLVRVLNSVSPPLNGPIISLPITLTLRIEHT